jgi:hypothetical protein
MCPWTLGFHYMVFNSRKFNGFNNCLFWSIIVVITLGKGAHRTPAGVRERHTCIGLMKNWKFIWKHHLHCGTSVALNMHAWVEDQVAESSLASWHVPRMGGRETEDLDLLAAPGNTEPHSQCCQTFQGFHIANWKTKITSKIILEA